MPKLVVWSSPDLDAIQIGISENRPGRNPRTLTDDERIAHNVSKWIPDGTPYALVDEGTFDLLDRYFRAAWRYNAASGASVDMTKARAIHMDKIRLVRNEELVKKDVPFMRAVEAGDASAQATIATEKQALRDIPATFDITTDAGTPEQLKAKWPAELPARE